MARICNDFSAVKITIVLKTTEIFNVMILASVLRINNSNIWLNIDLLQGRMKNKNTPHAGSLQDTNITFFTLQSWKNGSPLFY